VVVVVVGEEDEIDLIFDVIYRAWGGSVPPRTCKLEGGTSLAEHRICDECISLHLNQHCCMPNLDQNNQQ